MFPSKLIRFQISLLLLWQYVKFLDVFHQVFLGRLEQERKYLRTQSSQMHSFFC
jgi:hypothetical protein